MEANQEKKWCVYKHTNKNNGKVYIGQTCYKPEQRWKNGEGYKKSIRFYNAIKKYGWDNFDHEILFENLTVNEANKIEEELIGQYNSMNPENGYNLRSGGLNNSFSESSKEKLSQSRKGIKFSEDHKQKLSKAKQGKNHPNWGKHLSKETRNKIRENHADLSGENHPNWGKHRKLETKLKTSKPVRCIETNRLYYSAQEAERQTNIKANCIGECCKGKRKTRGGYHWEYVDINSEEYRNYLKQLKEEYHE